MDLALAGLRERGLQLDDQPHTPGEQVWSPSPELGLVLAARERPSYIVATEIGGSSRPRP